MSHILRTSIPRLHQNWKIEDLVGADNTDEIVGKVNKYVSDSRVLLDGNNLYIYSPGNGNGKTRIANYILSKLHEPRRGPDGSVIIVPAYSIKFGEYLISRREFSIENTAIRTAVMTVPILLLDDVSLAFCSGNMHNDRRELGLLMDHRREDMNVTIVTSNLTPAKFEENFGMTTASKVLENFSYIEVDGGDVRELLYPDKLAEEALTRGEQE